MATLTSLSLLPPKHSLVTLNVREVLEKDTVEKAKEISRKVNLEIEKKKEELRMLVGERYRDLIDAADTIGTMRTSSLSVFDKLTTLREKFNSLPAQLSNVKTPKGFDCKERLNAEELEMASELKLSLDVPRQIHVYLDKKNITAAVHLSLFYDKNLRQHTKPCDWTFLSHSGQNSEVVTDSLRSSILASCDEVFRNFQDPVERLAGCIIAKQTLNTSSCQMVLKEFLQQRVEGVRLALQERNSDFVIHVANTMQAVYSIFIDPQLYNLASKLMKKPKICSKDFGFKFMTKSMEQFNREAVAIEEPLKVSLLADVILQHFVQPLKLVLEQSYAEQTFLSGSDLKSFQELNEYRKVIVSQLQDHTDLIKIVLGTSKTLWSEIFLPVFQKKFEHVATIWIDDIFKFLEQDAFPRFQKLDEQFDLVSFVWKPPVLNEKSSQYSDVDLKLNCISPHVAGICMELEDQFQGILKDFQHLGDFSLLKEYISNTTIIQMQQFLERRPPTKSLFLGKFCSALTELCSTLWKLLNQNDKMKLRQILASKSESYWMSWTVEITKSFVSNLELKMCSVSPFSVTSFMPVAEDFVSEGEEVVKPSIHVPLQLSHTIHSHIFGICVELAKVGPQSIPKVVRENFRHNMGLTILQLYKSLLETSKAKESTDAEERPEIIPQVAIQLMFDLKFCQWFHPSLSEDMKSTLAEFQSAIDPFDLDIVIPRMKINLKRFLFETHLTLGLLFSEESHSFIAQNFKTKQNQSFPVANTPVSTPLPLLPI